MILTEKHIYKRTHKDFQELDNLCFLSKNLYNATLYEIRQYYFTNKKYLSYFEVNKIFRKTNQVDYRALPTKVSQLIQMLVDRNFKSFFALHKNGFNAKIPKYLSKNGRQVVEYTKQALSLKEKEYVKLSKTNIKIKTKIAKEKIQFVRVVPRNNYIIIEIGYNKQEEQLKIDNSKYASIDLGINNLMTVTSTEFKPYIINGKPVKSINQYYNKKVACYKSILEKCNKSKTSKKISKISLKRKNKIEDYFHKAVSYIMNQLVSNSINTLIIGYNKGWKQDINIGKVNNQNFVQIPFYTLIQMLKYKCELNGIHFVLQEESYTSKSSFYNNDIIPIYKKESKDFKESNFSGYRKYRGLYKIKNSNIIFNADVNGSYNIMRKYLGQVAKNIYNYINFVEVCSTPQIITV